jgi:hypothetical protein
MLSKIVDCDFDSLRIGDAVKLRLVAVENGLVLPMFAPAAAAGPGVGTLE